MVKQIPLQAVGTDLPQDMTNLMHAGHVEKGRGGTPPGGSLLPAVTGQPRDQRTELNPLG
jgi:hypothetical protein